MKLFSKNSETRKHSQKKEKGDVTLTYKSLISSFVAMLLCAGLFLGTSFAWFADSQSNTNNVLQTGVFTVMLVNSAGKDLSGDKVSIFDTETLKTPLSPAEGTNSYTSNGFYVKNTGDINSDYKLWIEVNESKTGAENYPADKGFATGHLEDVLKLTVTKNGKTLAGLDGTQTLRAAASNCIDSGVLNRGTTSEEYVITVTMPIDNSQSADIYQGASLKLSVVVIANQSTVSVSPKKAAAKAKAATADNGTVTIVPSAFKANADNPDVSTIRLYSSAESGPAVYDCDENGLSREEDNRLKVIANPSLAEAAVPTVEFRKYADTFDNCIVNRIDFQDTTVVFDDNAVVSGCSFVQTQSSPGTIQVVCKGNVTFNDCNFDNVMVCKTPSGSASFSGGKVDGETGTPTVTDVNLAQ